MGLLHAVRPHRCRPERAGLLSRSVEDGCPPSWRGPGYEWPYGFGEPPHALGMAPSIALYHRGMMMTYPINTADGRTRNVAAGLPLEWSR